MWKDFSSSYIKNNRASGISVVVAALISALMLSFLCSLFYNFWVGEVEHTISEEGNWQARITAELTEDDLITIQNFGNVESAVVNENLSSEEGTVVDVTFRNVRRIYQDVPLLVQKLELPETAASYHTLLLSRYLIHDPQDEEPPLLMTFYLVVLIVISVSLILIIRNSFALSMNERIHQFGILSGIGATPRQIRTCLMQEALMLCIAPIFLGCFIGIILSIGVVQAMNRMAMNIAGAYASEWTYHPLVFAVTIVSTVVTVLISAWLPAKKLSKMTPLEAIRNTKDAGLKRKKHSRILAVLFGIEGELAGNALRARKKAMRTSALSLTLSFLAFTVILCFFTLSDISTRHTYFERYQDAWDVMADIEDTKIENFTETEELKRLSGAQDVLVYQKAEAVCLVSPDEISGELEELGGLQAVAGDSVSKEGNYWSVKAPIVILDDEGFLEYCKKAGVTPRLDGTMILNRIWNSKDSVWRYPEYIPFLTGEQEKITLKSIQKEGESIEIPVIGYTQEVPVLREEYDQFTLVQFMPLSFWKSLSGRIGDAESDMFVRVLAESGDELSALDTLEKNIESLLIQNYEVEVENRMQEKLSNDNMIFGYKLVLGGLCVILALIGIANVFSNTLSFLRQRKREFARYMSVGMTPAGFRKMFLVEAFVIAGRPLLITLPLTVVAVGFMIKASYLNPMEFITEAPVIPVVVFYAAILGFVALAYYLGGRKVLRYNLSDALRDDTV